MSKLVDLTGKTFGRLTVIERAAVEHKNYAVWLCRCSCGNTKFVRSCHLINGATTSCGCYQKEMASKANTTHHLSRTRLYNEWQHMKKRCYWKNYKAYSFYGGKGIVVCDEWKDSFEAFRQWALNNGYSDELTLDRIDINKNYEPDNCRWTTKYIQANNRSICRIVEYHGEQGVYEGMCRKLNVNQTTIRYRMKKGYSFEEAVDNFDKTAPYYKVSS